VRAAAPQGEHEMTINELRDIVHTMGHACARFRLDRHAAEVSDDATCKELYAELERLYWAEATTDRRQGPPGEGLTVPQQVSFRTASVPS
jgi:hypothetical protein